MVVIVVKQWIMLRGILHSCRVGFMCLGRGMSCASGVSLTAAAAACVNSVVVTALEYEGDIGDNEVHRKC